MTATTTNRSKNAAVLSSRTKTATSAFSRIKAGRSWSYGEPGYTYGMLNSAVGIVYYGQVGSVTVANKIKN